MASKYDVIEDFKGYTEKVDDSKLEPGHFIRGSKNVVLKDSRNFGIRKGYTRVGQENSTLSGVTNSYDFQNFKGDERNLRVWGTNLEVLLDGSWRNIKSNLDSNDVYFSKQDFWDHEKKLAYAVFVNNSSKIMKWNGAIVNYLSSTTNTITKQGVETFAESGFEKYGRTEMEFKFRSNDPKVNGITIGVTFRELSTGTETTYSRTTVVQSDIVLTTQNLRNSFQGVIPATTATVTSEGNKLYITAKPTFHIVAYTTTDTTYDYIIPDPIKINKPKIKIGNFEYEYTGGWDTTVLTGVTPNPTGNGHVSGDYLHQSVEVINNSDILDIPDTNKNSAIEILNNQCYVASSENRFVYISEISRVDSFYFGRPERAVGEGGRLTLGGNFNAFIPDEDTMKIQFGYSSWLSTVLVDSSDLSSQSVVARLMDSGAGDGVIGKNSISYMKGNKPIYISKNKSLSYISKIENTEQPNTRNLSDKVKDLFGRLDLSDSRIIYHKYFIYIAIPTESVVLIYNTERQLWEAPQIMPISCFSIINGELHGHSAFVPETYKLFYGTSDNGAPIEAVAKMNYSDTGVKTVLKSFNSFFVQGFIEEKTKIHCEVLLDIDGSTGSRNFDIDGSQENILFKRTNNSPSLGKTSLGKRGIGNGGTMETLLNKFIAFKDLQNDDHYEYSFIVSSNMDDAQWEIVAYGPATDASEKQSMINKI